MANITKRGETYRIKVSCGYDASGKQVVRSKTYKPKPGMSEQQINKEVNRQAVLFEENCHGGMSLTAAKFEVFARAWFADYAEVTLKRLTVIAYHSIENRMYAALGHIRVDRITPLDIQRYIRSLTAEGLCASTVKNHVRLVSVILNYGIRKRLLAYNPCVTADYPKSEEQNRDFYSLEDMRAFLRRICEENDTNLPFAVFFALAAFTGCRKGEILGFEWKDMDWVAKTIAVRRAYYYDNRRGECFTDTPKSAAGRRVLALPGCILLLLEQLREWQDRQREIFGGSWVETDRLITKQDGAAMHPSAPYAYLRSFCKRTGMRMVKIHSFRHFNASVLINSGVDVVSVQQALGHSTAATTLNIYAHAFKDAQSKVAEAVAGAIGF
jgi:integrase